MGGLPEKKLSPLVYETPTDQGISPMTLSKEQIEAIQARAEKATPGEWGFAAQCGMRGHCDMAQVFDASGHSLADIEPTPNESEATATADFIAHARIDVPALCQQALRAIELEYSSQKMFEAKEEMLAMKHRMVIERNEEIERLQSELTATRKALEEATADACDEEIVAAITEEPMATRTPSRIVHYLKKHGLKIVRALPSPQVEG